MIIQSSNPVQICGSQEFGRCKEQVSKAANNGEPQYKGQHHDEQRVFRVLQHAELFYFFISRQKFSADGPKPPRVEHRYEYARARLCSASDGECHLHVLRHISNLRLINHFKTPHMNTNMHMQVPVAYADQNNYEQPVPGRGRRGQYQPNVANYGNATNQSFNSGFSNTNQSGQFTSTNSRIPSNMHQMQQPQQQQRPERRPVARYFEGPSEYHNSPGHMSARVGTNTPRLPRNQGQYNQAGSSSYSQGHHNPPHRMVQPYPDQTPRPTVEQYNQQRSAQPNVNVSQDVIQPRKGRQSPQVGRQAATQSRSDTHNPAGTFFGDSQ